MNLTSLAIGKIRPPEKGQKTYFDDQLPGFGVRVSQKTKSYIVMYGSDRRLKTLGRYPDLALKDARREAMRYLSRNRARVSNMSLEDARTAFLDEVEGRNRPSTYKEYKRYLNYCTYSGNVRNLTRNDLKEYTSTPHALTAYKVFLNWCLRNELIDRSPLANDRAAYGPSRLRVLAPDEIRVIWSYEHPPYTDIVKLLLIMGQRRGETTKIEEAWIEGDLIHFPPGVTKNKKQHTIPFGEMAKRYLPPNTFAGWGRAKENMNKVVDIEPWTLHDLRRTFATMHAEIGTPIHVTEKLLNHSSGTLSGVAGIYNRHTYLEEMRAAVTNYDAHLTHLLNS